MSAYYYGPIPLAEPILGLFNAHEALDTGHVCGPSVGDLSISRPIIEKLVYSAKLG